MLSAEAKAVLAGIVPRLRDVSDWTAPNTEAVLRAQAETAFYDEVKSLLCDKVTFVHDGGDPSKGLNLKETFGTPSPGTHLYVCGPGGLLNAVKAATS